ncbi:GNAT family N-acetyltransferase [Hoeflea sp.]
MIEAVCDGPRAAKPSDARACAEIVNGWIDGRDWMPRVHSREDVIEFYEKFVFKRREVWVSGNPVSGFVALDVFNNMVTALYVSNPGMGIGKALLDHAKTGRDMLELWTFVANEDARRFYAREGFREIRVTEGDNEEGLPDMLWRWERSA